MSWLAKKTASTLEGLADEINAEHRACESAAISAVQHAIRAGEMLAEVKAGLKHGEWLPWLKANFDGTPRTAQVYMRLHSKRAELPNAQRASHLSIRGALASLELEAGAKEKPSRKPYATRYTPISAKPGDDVAGLWTTRDFYSMEEYAEACGYRVSPPLLIDPEFSSLLPPLRDHEYAGLEKSIRAEGCRDAIVVWNNTILDGHARYEICVKHGIDYLVADKEMASRDDAMMYIIDKQVGRTNLSEVMAGYLRAKEEVRQIADKRSISQEEAWEQVLGPEA